MMGQSGCASCLKDKIISSIWCLLSFAAFNSGNVNEADGHIRPAFRAEFRAAKYILKALQESL